jgi:hypothetical protein
MKRFRSLGAALVLAIASLLTAFLPPAHAQDMSDVWENALIDHLFRAVAYTAPTPLYFGLATAACSDSGFGTEVSGGSYARVSVTPNSTNFANTQNSGTGASSGTGGQTSNLTAITFPAPTANWGSISHFFIATASSAGSILVCKSLTTAKTVNSGDASPSFAIGAFTFTLQ